MRARQGGSIRALRAAAILAALFGSSGAMAQSGPPVDAVAAPPKWLAYAERVTERVTAALTGPEVRAIAVRTALDASRTDLAAPSAPLVLKLWFRRAGGVAKMEFAPLGDSRGDAALRSVVEAMNFGPPPARMRMPLRVAIQLEPEPALDPSEEVRAPR